MSCSLIRALTICCAVTAAPGLLSVSFAQVPPVATTAATFTLELPPAAAPQTAGFGSAQFIGNATVLLRYRGLTILTAPNFLHKGDHVHLGYGLRSQRPGHLPQARRHLPAGRMSRNQA